MARNWGGDGIEKFLLPGETVQLRFANYYLTNRRLGHYRALSSTFEFVPLGEFDIREGHGKLVEWTLAIIMIFFLSSAVVAFFWFNTGPQVFLLVFAGVFQFFFGYTVLIRFYKDSYIVRQRNGGRKLIIRSFNTEQGLSFALEVVKANNAFLNIELSPQGSASS